MKRVLVDQRRFRMKSVSQPEEVQNEEESVRPEEIQNEEESVRPEENEDIEESVPKRLRPEENNLSLCFEVYACTHVIHACNLK